MRPVSPEAMMPGCSARLKQTRVAPIAPARCFLMIDNAGCPDMPPRLAYTCFDAAVNNGVGRAVRWLQAAIGTGQDGSYGPRTKAALDRAAAGDPLDLDLAAEVHAQRLFFMAGLDAWKNYGLGWSRRLARVPLQSGHHWPA
jgi:lysozyme family protein